MGVLFSWWLVCELLGIVGLPLTATLFANLPDRGWSLSKPLSLLALGWLIWFPLTLVPALPFTRGWILGTALLFALGNAALLWRRRATRAALARLLARQRGYLALTEALFAGAFALLAWARTFTPAVVDTEKFMDVAFLSAIWRAPHLPPPDPWLSGATINYYYYGHYLMALFAKTLLTPPDVAFNVAVALTFALAATAIFGVATNIAAVARRHSAPLGADPGDRSGETMVGATSAQSLLPAALAGIIAVILTLIVGNLNGAQVWYHIASTLSGPGLPLHGNPWAWWTQRDLWPQYDWWAPSRVIANTINEFPAFSFALADLHAHVLALPFAALAIALAFNLLLSPGEGIGVFGRRGVTLLNVLMSGIVLGALYAINGWDLPTYLGLAVLALLIQQWLAHRRVIDSVLLLDLATAIILLVALALFLYFPFYRDFTSPSLGVGVVPATQHTPIGYEIAIFGLPLFLALSLLAIRLMSATRQPLAPREDGAALRWPLLLGGSVALLALLTLLTSGGGLWTIFWGLLIIGGCAWLALRKLDFHLTWGATGDAADDDAEQRGVVGVGRAVATKPALAWNERADLWVYILIGTATALIVTCELIYLRDIFGGTPTTLGVDFRMNTVFKLYYQAWLIFGVVSGPLVVWLVGAACRSLVAALPAAMWRRIAHGIAGGDEPQGALAFGTLGTAAGREVRLRGGAGATTVATAGQISLGRVSSPRRRTSWPQALRRGFNRPLTRWLLAMLAYVTQPRVALATPAVAPGRILLAAKATSARKGAARRAKARAAASGGRPAMQTRRGSPEAASARSTGADPADTTTQRPEEAPAERTDLSFAPADMRRLAGVWLRAVVGAVWLAALVALVAAALIYPVLAVAARSDNATLPHSLDGAAYMATDSMNSGDQYAIAWLNTHVSGDPVIVEAARYNEYTHLGRVSAFTGMSTLMGWGGHEVQWRYNWLLQPGRANLIGQRLDAVNQIYTNPSQTAVLSLLRQYDVRFVYVGAAERLTYPNANFARFAAFLHVVYQYDGVTIYAVP